MGKSSGTPSRRNKKTSSSLPNGDEAASNDESAAPKSHPWRFGVGIGAVVAAGVTLVAVTADFTEIVTNVRTLASSFSSPVVGRSATPDEITVTCSAPTTHPTSGLVTVTFTVADEGTRAVGLGVGLYDEGEEDWATGRGDIDKLQLNQGTGSGSRDVEFEAETPPGDYEVVLEVWPADQIGEDGVETLSEVSCGTVTQTD